jgi:uncharacterized membrane protein required for colicin V production
MEALTDGTGLFVFYDIFAVLIILGCVVHAYSKGIIAVAVRIAATLIGLVLAFMFYVPVSEFAYEKIVAPSVQKTVNSNLSEISDATLGVFSVLPHIDTNKITIGGTSVNDLVSQSKTGNILIELNKVDLSGANIPNSFLETLGINDTLDGNYGKAEFPSTLLKDYSIGDILFSRIVSECLTSQNAGKDGTILKQLTSALAKFNIGGASEKVTYLFLPLISADSAGDNTKDFVSTTVIERIVKPTITPLIEILTFTALFVILSAVVGLLLSVLKIFAKLPFVGFADRVIGGLAGLVSGVIAVFIISAVIKLIIVFTGNNLTFLNSDEIGKSHIFSRIYNAAVLPEAGK